MKIAVWHNLPSGGGKRALFNHVRGLVEAGHQVEAWAPPTINRDYLPLETMIAQHIVPLDLPEPDWRDKLRLRLPMTGLIAAMEAHGRACAAEIAAGGFDLLFANTDRMFFSPSIGRFVDLPSVLYLQEPCRWLYEAMPNNVWAAPSESKSLRHKVADQRRTWNDRVQVRAEIENARAYDRIFCNSYFSRESILRAYGIEAEVCYLGVDQEQFEPGPDAREPYVIALGAFAPNKNPRLCIEAVGRMKGKRPSLLWIGNIATPGFHDEMSGLARDRGVDLEVRIDVPDAELLDRLRHASAMIYTPRLEPFGLAPLEANACGTPVVAVAEGGIRETVISGENGIVTDADPGALATALEQLLADPALARRMGARGRELVETKWSLSTANARLIAKLESALARR